MNDFLEKVLAGHPVQTRDGRKAKFIAHVPERKNNKYKLFFMIEDEIIHAYSENGQDCAGPLAKDENAIILAPEPPHVLFDRWVNVYPENTTYWHSVPNSSEYCLYTAHLRFWSDGRVEQVKE